VRALGVVALSAILVSVWLSLICVLVLIERVLFTLLTNSAVRSVVGMGLYAAWALFWYAALRLLSSRLIRRHSE